ncbi:hypothetical protein I7I53_09539 [Histoplasma capsulatum var. duboisii H88]|uniref:Uncharacterized protein n=1 Tax=Ajellomyces capsulatus (strain H88) TaxID=544711 RepID=A0A8A1L4B5_AJEC8|nr:hypothetical protein I7I53_09539 [Histoplasma capsulatum var. duboisii H88]
MYVLYINESSLVIRFAAIYSGFKHCFFIFLERAVGKKIPRCVRLPPLLLQH